MLVETVSAVSEAKISNPISIGTGTVAPGCEISGYFIHFKSCTRFGQHQGSLYYGLSARVVLNTTNQKSSLRETVISNGNRQF